MDALNGAGCANGNVNTISSINTCTLNRPLSLDGLKTYELRSRPSKVFKEDQGRPLDADAALNDFFDALPRQLGANDFRKVRDHVCRAYVDGRTVAAAFGGHVIKTGCGSYLIDWIERGILKGVHMNGSAAIHDLELALAGKTSEDVAAQLPGGHFGMARETADAFAIAARAGTEKEQGLGAALGKYLVDHCDHSEASVLVAACKAGIPCTVHVAMGTDIVHMHPHVSGAALGEATMIDFRKLCTVVSTLEQGVWFNIGSAVIMPEVFVKAVSVVRNFGHNLDGLVCVNCDKNGNYRSRVNVLDRPSAVGIELIGQHELLIPLLHTAVACKLGAVRTTDTARAA